MRHLVPQRPVSPELRVFRWFLPYCVIWGAASWVLVSLSRGGQCTGFCALYTGSLMYGVAAVALSLTVVVAAVEMLFSWRS